MPMANIALHTLNVTLVSQDGYQNYNKTYPDKMTHHFVYNRVEENLITGDVIYIGTLSSY